MRNVLDMRSGVRCEDYTDLEADVWQIGESPGGIYGYLPGLVAEAPHGKRFMYRSAETDVLGWVCERVAGRPMADLITTFVWQPMGAEFDAEIICDTTKVAWHDGGLCATARDAARFGQMLLDGGTVPAGDDVRTVIGPKWLRAAWAVDADIRWVFAASPNEASMPGGWYRDPVLVPARQLRRCPAVLGNSRTDDSCEPADPNGVRQILDLAGCAEPGLPTRTPCAPSTTSAAGSAAGIPASTGIGCRASCRVRTGTARPTGPRNPTTTDRISPFRRPPCRMVIRCKFEEADMTEPKPRTPRKRKPAAPGSRDCHCLSAVRRSTASPRSAALSDQRAAHLLRRPDRFQPAQASTAGCATSRYIVYYDSWDGAPSAVFTPKNKPFVEFD